MALGRAADAFGVLAGLLALAGAFFAAGWAAVGFAVAAGLAAAAFGLAGAEAVLAAAVAAGFAGLAFSTGFDATAFAEDEAVFAASDFAAAGFAEALVAGAFGLVALAAGAVPVLAAAAAVGFAAGLVASAALAAAGLTGLLAAGVFVLAWVGFAAAGFVSAGALALAVDLTEPVFVAFATCSSLDDMGRLDPSWAGAAAPCDWRCPRRKTLLPTMYCDYSFACKSCPNGSLAGICNRVPATRWARPFPSQTAVGGFCTSTKDTGLHIPVMSS
jgi:hypothetical protein